MSGPDGGLDARILETFSKRLERTGALDTELFSALCERIERVEGSAGRGGGLGMSAKELAAILHGLVQPLRERIAELEANKFEYAGTHKLGESYAKNQFVTHNGSLWACRRVTTQRPGDGSDWTLCCKRGADAKGVNTLLAKEWQA